ncbi:cation:proton antiporter [Tepidicaulis sp. LMO-SS28]|uniref:cation:proton antiporter n=1 Tax=Tepidicaulis sp. LMO-SS28 TaxID=3447455 RepID=UPI003EE18576
MTPIADPAIAITLIVATGVIAQWLGARFRVPAILPLLFAGFLLGPGIGVLDPDAVFGDLLFPVISMAVAVILFEGALTLRFADLRGAATPVIRLVTIGVVITVAVLAWAAHEIFGFPWPLALLFGSIGAVSGPTVVMPLLRTVRPTEKVAQILRWEGILIDPVGAVLAVVLFEAIIAAGALSEGSSILSFIRVFALGGAIGAGLGFGFGWLLKRHLIPDYLINISTLGLVLLSFTASNMAAHESGLVAVTVMGIVLGNMKGLRTGELIDFKESLSVLLISALFIVLAARVDFGPMASIAWQLVLLMAVVLFVARPLNVLVSTLGSDTSWRERALLAWIAPRGIVAAAISAIFAVRLMEADVEGAELLVPLTLVMIVVTVVLQSLTARPLADLLKVAEPAAKGVLIVGGNPFALALAETLHEKGVRVLVADTSWSQTRTARMKGLPVFFGNPVSEHADRELDLIGLGTLLAMSRQPALNALAATRYRHEFGSANVFSVRHDPASFEKDGDPLPLELRGHVLFKPEMTLEKLQLMMHEGFKLRVTRLTEEYPFDKLSEHLGGTQHMLLAISPQGLVKPFSEETNLRAGPDWRILYLEKVSDEEKAEKKKEEKAEREKKKKD